MVQKALRSDSSSQNSLSPCRDWLEARGEGLPSPNRTLLATGKMGRGREWGGSASHTVSPRGWKLGGKGICSFFDNVALEPAAEQNEWFSPCPPSGEGVALSSPSPEIKQLPTSPGCLCQGRFIASLDDIGASWNTGGAALLREARRAGLRFSTGRSSSGGHRRAPTATSRLGLALRRSGASRRGKMCCLGLLLYCRELLGTVLDSVAEQSSLGVRSSQHGRAIDGALGPQMWTSPSRGTVLWLPSPVGRGQSLSAVPASTSGWYYPRAFNALAWCARRIALACSAEAAWPAAL